MRQILWMWLLITLAVVDGWCHSCYGCLEEERIGLLEIEDWINHPDGNSWKFEKWGSNKDEDADCCTWNGVQCGNTTRRVIELDLDHARTDWSSVDLYFNLSLFLPFKELQNLYLSWNNLVGHFEINQGFEVLSSRLAKLVQLDLRDNRFDDSIFLYLRGLLSLKELALSGNMLTGSTGVNASGLRNLESIHLSRMNFNEIILLRSLKALPLLNTLYLEQNNLNGMVISQELYNLTKLEELYLDGSSLPENFLQKIGAMSALKVLSLAGCDLNRSLPTATPVPRVPHLRKLEVLYLDYLSTNNGGILLQSLGGAMPSLKTLHLEGNDLNKLLIGEEFYKMKNLKELYLDDSSLPTDFLQRIGALTALEVLTLRQCSLNGTLPTQGWCELKNLQNLSLAGNQLEGTLPECLGNMSSLLHLDVSQNLFVGDIASGPLTHLTSLESLSISSNHFQIPMSFKSFLNHSNLKSLSCCENEIIADPNPQNLVPNFQLRFLNLSKALLAEIPNFLYTQYDLRFLDLSRNNISGMFPYWMLENNTKLEELYLGENSFVGPLHLPHHSFPNLETIQTSNNKIHGQIPRNICSVFPNLEVLLMADNELSGGIPPCFKNMSYLDFLDLSNNHLTVASLEQLTSFWFLKLSNNNLDGEIPPSIFNSSTMQFLYLDGNRFGGKIWGSLIVNFKLIVMDISRNRFSCQLPKMISNVSSLLAIDLSKNQFWGQIPTEFCKFHILRSIDLSENNLSEPIPSCFNLPKLSHVHLQNNKLSGPLTNSFANCSSLVTLDLRYNNIIGPIPSWIGNLSVLGVLLVKANLMYGEFPIQLCLLKKLSILDISRNKLSGALPFCLGNFSFKTTGSKTYHSHFVAEHGAYRNPLEIVDEVVEFTTKKNPYNYSGDILEFMSGIDLSCNEFTGEIPKQMGNLNEIHALNLSHNNFSGIIPVSFSNLQQIESLDLSHNNLNGGIPPQLVQLTNLEVFSVAHNNLSGKTPEYKNQFGTFDASSYEGNPFLCGPPLQSNCNEEEPSSQLELNDGEQEYDGFMDMEVFYVSFGVSYIMVVLTIATILYINPYWRRRWLYFIEECINTIKWW